MKRVFIILGFSSLIGCTPFGGFKAVPMSWTRYASNGAGEREIRAALLECGNNVPGEPIEFPSPVKNGTLFPFLTGNDSLAVVKCMENGGFSKDEKFEDTCKFVNQYLKSEDYPVCQPDAIIPKRSIENRLNSPYCKLYPKANICQADYDPAKAEPKKPIQSNRAIDSTSITPSASPATTLQEQVQKNSNSQMNQLLQGTSIRK